MTFKIEEFSTASFIDDVAERVAASIRADAPVMITGGDTVGRVYESLARLRPDWAGIDILFSDERAVPPDDDRSNYKLAKTTLFDRIEGETVHRMKGEEAASVAARSYHEEIDPLMQAGIPLAVLGLGDNAHIAGLFPHDPSLDETDSWCVGVRRPDGMEGITLTPPALMKPDKILFIVSGASKAEAVGRAMRNEEPASDAPVCLLADHPDCTLLVDTEAAPTK